MNQATTREPQHNMDMMMQHPMDLRVQGPTQPFYHHYDLWMQLEGPNAQEYSEWEVLLAFLYQLSTIDLTTTILPCSKQDKLQEHWSVKLATTSVNFLTYRCMYPDCYQATQERAHTIRLVAYNIRRCS